MITRFTFIHISSSRSLIRRCRKKILKISKKRSSTLPKLFKKLKVQISYANEKKTNKIMKKILKQFHKSEILSHEIFFNQILVVYEIQKRQIKSEKSLKNNVKNIYSELKPNQQSLLKESNKILQEIREQISWLIDIIRDDERNILFNRKLLQLKYITPIAFEASIQALKRYFITERRLSSKEKKLEKKIVKQIKKIPKLVKKIIELKKKIPKLEAKIKATKKPIVRAFLIKKLKRLKKKLKRKIKELDDLIIKIKNNINELKSIVKDLTEILREIFLISTRFRIKFKRNLGLNADKEKEEVKILNQGLLYETLKLLERKDFSKNKLNKLEKERQNIINNLRIHNYNEEKMVLHEKRIDDRQSNHKIAA